MADLQLVFAPQSETFDLGLDAAGSFLTGNDLANAGKICLFTDRRALPSDKLPPGTTNPRGSVITDDKGRPIGSRLWLLRRAPRTQANLLRARDFCLEALQCLQDDGVVARNVVTCAYSQARMLSIAWEPVMPTVTASSAFNYSWAWMES